MVPPFWELPDGFTEPFYRSGAVPIQDSRLCGCLASVEDSYPVEHNAAFMGFVFTNCS